MTRGNKIRTVRQAAGLRQVELAKRIGVSKQTLYKYEMDVVTNIPSDKIYAIAQVCDTTPEYLMGWEEQQDEAAMLKRISAYRAHLDRYLALDEKRKEQANSYIEFLYSEMRREG